MPVLHLYLNPWTLQGLTEGRRSMPGAVKRVVEAAGWTVALHPEADRPQASRLGDFHKPDVHMPDFHMVMNQPVEAPHTLTLRISGWEPFWRIEPTNDRWDWDLANLHFTPEKVGARNDRSFVSFWRRRLFADLPVQNGGGIFVPLQGKLLQHRHFQSASPIVMLQSVLTRWPDRSVKASLHPREIYSAAERIALADLARTHTNLILVEAGSDPILAACDLVVTENSTMALKGYLLEKPAMLWARMDFHHIAASVPRLGRDAAFAQAEAQETPDFARYLYWYFRNHALLVWDANLDAQIARRLKTLGWPL